ncbi:unnamed protein product, partial [Meganyctiphanes norvegica]
MENKSHAFVAINKPTIITAISATMSLTDKYTNKSYTNKFKLLVVELSDKVGGNRKAAELLGCSESNINDLKKQVPDRKDAPENKHTVKLNQQVSKWPEIERRVLAFIDERKANGLRFSRAMLHLEANKAAKDLHIKNFKGSTGWCSKLLRRTNNHILNQTKIIQNPPHQFEDKITEFKRIVIQHLRDCNYQLMCFGNVDETLINMDMIPRSSVNNKGEKTIVMQATGYKNSNYTVVLAAMANGDKLPPMLIFKRKKMPKCTFPKGVVVHCNEKGRVDKEACKIWIRKVWKNRSNDIREKSLLICDRLPIHLTPEVAQEVLETNTDVAVIPAGLRNILQPIDVSLKNSFKAELRDRLMAWMAAGEYTHKKMEKIKPPPLDMCAKWVKESWDEIKKPLIIKAFNECCIQIHPDYESNEETEVDEHLPMEEESYDDEMQFSDSRELIGGDHVDEN